MTQEAAPNPGLFSDRDQDNWVLEPAREAPHMYNAHNRVSGERFFGTLKEFNATLGLPE